MPTPRLAHPPIGDEVLSYVRSGGSVALVGLPGSGRSRILREVGAELDLDGWRVVRVAGVRELQDRPLAALAIAGVEIQHGAVDASSIATAFASLQGRLGAGACALMIDDGDDLDDASVGVVAALRQERSVPTVVATRPGSDGPGVARLHLGSAAVSVHVPPLRYEAMHMMLLEMLGPVEPVTLARLADKSGGLPGLLTAMVRTDVASGRLADVDGLWRTTGDLWCRELSEAVSPLIAGLSDDQIDGLFTLAVAGTVRLSDVTRIVEPAVLGALEDAGLVHVFRYGSEAVVAIYPELLADHLRQEQMAMRHLRAEEHIRATTGGELLVRFDPLGSAQAPAWAPGAGESGSMLNQQLRVHWAEEVSTRRALWERTPRPSTALPYVQALHNLVVEPGLTEEVFEGTSTIEGEESALAGLIVWRACDAALADEDPAAADRVIDQYQDAMPAFQALFRATGNNLRFLLDRVPDDERFDVPAGRQEQIGLEALAVSRAEALVSRGRVRTALATLDEVGIRGDTFLLRSAIVRGIALLFDGRVEEAINWASEHLRAARADLDAGGIAGHSYVIALVLTMAGRQTDLDRHLDAALSLDMAPPILRHFHMANFVMASLSASRRGRDEHALSLAHQARVLHARPGPHPCMVADVIPAFGRALTEADAATSMDRLWDHVRDRLSRGYLAHAVFLSLWGAARQPEPEITAQIEAELAGAESEPLRLLAGCAVALGDRDSAALRKLGDQLLECGFSLPGAIATITALASSRDIVPPVQLARETQSLWDQMVSLGCEPSTLFHPLAASVELSAREREIAALLAEGLSAAEIAQRLVLSARTVESHVLSAYRKAGVDNRHDLARAMQTWLAEA